MQSLIKIFFFLFLFIQINYSQDSLIVWQNDLEKSISVPPVFDGKHFFIFTENGEVICLDADGKFLWNYETFGTISSSPFIENDLLAVPTFDGDLFIININTGNLHQVIGIGEPITSKNIILTDYSAGGSKGKAIIAGTEYGNLYCYDLYTLEQLWVKQVSENSINSSIISSGQKIFFYDKTKTLSCIDVSNGLLIWKWKILTKNAELIFNTDLVIHQNNLYLVSPEGNLYCVDVMLGTEKWNIKKINASGLIMLNKNNLILPTIKNKLLSISTKTGKVEKEIDLAPETIESKVMDMMIIGKKMFAGFNNGSVYEINSDKSFREIFRSKDSGIVSFMTIGNNYLITDSIGVLTLIKIPDTPE